MVKIRDPSALTPADALRAAREASGLLPASVVAGLSSSTTLGYPTPHPVGTQTGDPLKDDFRVFLTMIWRHLLNCDPNPEQLDMAWYLQHGPNRSIIEAFRGFSKSWITGAYALWRLYVDAQEKVLVISGSLARAVATTNWCLSLIMEMPLLEHLRPKQKQRQSSKAFDVGPALPSQSPSFHALGIGGQIVGFRGTCIIPDDVETQQNSLTIVMREKNREAVKEFDSVLVPPVLDEHGAERTDVLQPCIKFLGTPHDEDSLYRHMVATGIYDIRIWPARYPDAKRLKTYGDTLAPLIRHRLLKYPELVGKSTMPNRFSDDDLRKREMSLGSSEFSLQFLLDTSLSDRDKYPLKLKDLMVMALDIQKGPESVVWSDSPENRLKDLPAMGHQGDFYHQPAYEPSVTYTKWNRVVAAIDSSGRGKDETAMSILAELHSMLFLQKVKGWLNGYDVPTLKEIAALCVAYSVNLLVVEANFGDGMFAALLQPHLTAAWEKHNKDLPRGHEPGGTEIVEVRSSNQMAKEKRCLAVMEPVTQQHRLVVARAAIEEDYESLNAIEGEETRHNYAWGYQYTHLTRDKDSLRHDDRLESTALAVAQFADILGVDPDVIAKRCSEDREEEEWQKLFGDVEEDGVTPRRQSDDRAVSLQRTTR